MISFSTAWIRNHIYLKTSTRKCCSVAWSAISGGSDWDHIPSGSTSLSDLPWTDMPDRYESWKRRILFSEQGWCLINANGVLVIMDAKEQRRSLTPLHGKLEALIWAIECIVINHELAISFQTYCWKLVKMVLDPRSDLLSPCYSQYFMA